MRNIVDCVNAFLPLLNTEYELILGRKGVAVTLARQTIIIVDHFFQKKKWTIPKIRHPGRYCTRRKSTGIQVQNRCCMIE